VTALSYHGSDHREDGSSGALPRIPQASSSASPFLCGQVGAGRSLDPLCNDTINEEDSMSRLQLSARLALALPLIVSMAGCAAGDQLVGSPSVAFSREISVTRGGVEGLRQDIADLRAVPSGVRIGTSIGASISPAELASELEAQLGALSGTATAPTFPGRAASPSPGSPRFDYEDPADVGGQTAAYPSGTDSRGYRYESVFAYTSCSSWTGIIARVEPRGTLNNFATGAVIGPLGIGSGSMVNYASTSQQMGIIYPERVSVSVRTTHTCEIRDSTGQFPFKYTYGFTVI
jgi:hypothetical protein